MCCLGRLLKGLKVFLQKKDLDCPCYFFLEKSFSSVTFDWETFDGKLFYEGFPMWRLFMGTITIIKITTEVETCTSKRREKNLG